MSSYLDVIQKNHFNIANKNSAFIRFPSKISYYLSQLYSFFKTKFTNYFLKIMNNPKQKFIEN